ncbi:MAG: amidohydrolase family protein [Eubacteriales bacterium]|nr:amidohydrolase family protein [Eubacteriales bacterium]
MFGECHAHIFMDGLNYRTAVAEHKNSVNIERVREHLRAYQVFAIPFVRDGGDRFGVSEKAKELAGEYGIDYRTPVFAIHRMGHYGHIVGVGAESLGDYREKVEEVRRRHGDFIKIMVSGIIEYDCFGRLSEEALEPEWIKEMIHIAHAEGFAVMVHANGREAVLPAVLAGADSIEHGNYIDGDCMDAMADTGCIWVPTIVTTANLFGCGRYEDEILKKIYDMECENLSRAYEKGVQLALGSDAGAYMVPHGKGVCQEREVFERVLGTTEQKRKALGEHLRAGETKIRQMFRQ